ncbi:MAG: alpha-amylase family glycosyl hydrolase [Bacteroidales bacterium]|nr:alpha-amylase family glycosyl hydrolase [Bacteroidales bacterium]
MRFRSTLAAILAAAALVGCKTAPVESTAETNDDVILHAWCWSFNTIKENLKDIADAGYTIVQTSPAQHCIQGTNRDPDGGMQLFGHGYWYYHYQPTDWKIGNQHVGTEEDLIALCNEANKYGIKIIIDVLPNHTTPDQSKVEADLDAAVGGRENLYHANGRNRIRNYDDRYECTTGEMGGLPDVNTENPDFQAYYMTYVNQLLKDGVRGFRYDTAKHIGLPCDPKDDKSPENDFWDVATGRKAANGVSLALPMDELFIYGEVLQGRNVREKEYSEYIGLTASSMGDKIRDDVKKASWTEKDVLGYSHLAEPSKLVTWVESHDTYCNNHESAWMTDEQIRVAWVYLVSRQNGTPLFYSRPDGSDGPNKNYWGNNVAGAKGNDEFKNPAVVAANKFRAAMAGKPESVSFENDGAIAQVVRGNSGAAILNITDAEQTLNATTSLADGKYKDKVSGKVFKVKNGVISGTVAPYGTYILYK